MTTAGTIISAAGTVVLVGRALQLCETIAKRQDNVNLIEYGEIGFKLAGVKRVFTITMSDLERES